MATNFPGALDNATSLPYPTALNGRNAPSLAQGQDNQNDALIAVEGKLGIGSSTPTSGNLLIGTGTGSSSWSKAAPTGTIVGTTDTQTLTNKTLTSATINSPIITNATITADTISGFTTSNTGTIYGLPISSGQISASNTVNGSSIVGNTITTSAIQWSSFSTPILYISAQPTDRTRNSSTAAQVPSTTGQVFTSKTGIVKITMYAHMRVNTETGNIGIFRSDTSTFVSVASTNLTGFAPNYGVAFLTVTPNVAITYTPYFSSQSGASTVYISAYTNLGTVIEDVI